MKINRVDLQYYIELRQLMLPHREPAGAAVLALIGQGDYMLTKGLGLAGLALMVA